MQLIVDTDTEISVQTKMSAIQQESLSEKFNNTSSIQNQEIVVKACDKNVEAADQAAQSIATNQIPILNNESNDKCEELKICDKESTENNEKSTQIEVKKDAQEKVNSEITIIKLDTLVEEKIEIEVNNVEHKNNSEINNKTKQENKQDCEFDKDELNNRLLEIKLKTEEQIKENTEKDNVETQDDVNISIREYKIDHQVDSDIKDTVEEQVEVTNVTEDESGKQNQENIEMDITIDEQDKINNIVTVDTFEGQVEVTDVVAEDKSGNQNEVKVTNETEYNNEKENHQNIGMDITNDEQDTISVNLMANKIGEVVHKMENRRANQKKDEVNDETKDKIENKENIEVDVPFEEQGKINIYVTADKVEKLIKVTHERENDIEKQNEGNIEMDVTVEEQDKININATADNIKELVEKTHELEDKIGNVNVENMELDVIIEEQVKINSSVTAGKVVEEIDMTHEIKDKCEMQSGENMEMDIAIEEQDKVTSSVTGDIIKEDVKFDNAIEDQVKVISEKEGEIVQGNQNNSDMDVTFEEQGKVNISVSNDKIEEGNEKNSEVDVSLEERDEVNNSVIEDKLKEKIKVANVIENKIIGEQVKLISDIENEIRRGSRENNEKDVTVEEQDNVNTSVAENKSEELHTEKGNVLEKEKNKLEEPEHLINSVKENKTEGRSNYNNEIKVMFDKLCEEKSEIQDKFEVQQNEISDIINKLEQEEEESQVKDNICSIDQVQINSDIEDRHNAQINIPKDFIANFDKGSVDNCEINKFKNNLQVELPHVNAEKDIDKNRLEDITKITHELAQKSSQFEKICQGVEKHKNDSERMSEDVQNATKVDDEIMIENTEQNVETQDSNEEKSLNTFKSNTESVVTQMNTDEVIDIADEKDEDNEKELENTEKNDTSVRKSESALKNDIQENKSIAPDEVAVVSNDISDSEASTQEENVEQTRLKKPITETVEEKKKLTHISKLSNTLDILSDEEEDLPKEAPQKEMPASSDKECMSINIDDDDDIMLIDEESSPKHDKNKTESTTEPEKEVHLTEESIVELKDKEEKLSENSENKKGAIQAEVAAPSITEMKTSEPKLDLIAQEETSASKKPLVKMNFLKTCKKNLADMTRDEIEEFCILKIVESVVDRSSLSEIKSQFKGMAQNIEEYKKKASALTKQNRDLQVVLKSVQEEQKKKSNMPITPLKITRSVGMQVLMTDKVAVRKKSQNPNTAKNNASTNSGPNRQGKTPQNHIKLPKILTHTTHNTPIPVPRLVPAINNSNMNNLKIQPSPANTSGKSQVTGPVNKSPVPNVSNGLPATPLILKAEKRPHSRMQQSDAQSNVTVDLTDDEPPAKVISRNVAPPVRLVPPQNLLAPNRQPFGQNVSNPRKVYIPISGSQTQVGVRPGQTIMLRTISPQGPRPRVPTPGVAKPNQSPSAVRMQRVPSRHPAPLPESVKQYQPQNWKALPPAPELKLTKVDNGIVISWKIDGYQEETYEEIASYQLYAYQETTSPPSTALWKKIGDVKALALPMACTLTQFMAGYKYYFAVRAVDIRSRLGPFSLPGSILLLNKM